MIPPDLLAPLRRRISSAMGLHVAGRGWADLDRRIADAARDAGVRDPSAYARQLLSGPLGQDDLRRLARFLTVGETYFFRDPAAFAAIERVVLPAAARAGRPLRIWSAGCCTGEEPYSLAMLVDRVLPDPGSVEIVATDVNPQFLDAARRAVYGEWSFRGVDDSVRARHFTPTADGKYRLADRIRRRVRFVYGNLVDASSPAGPFDLILCRNVLMYFTPAQTRAAVSRLRAALHDDGHLLVSAAETSSTLFADFGSRTHGDVTLYTKTPQPVAATARPLPVRRAAPPRARAVARVRRDRPAPAPDHAGAARAFADAGRLDDAATACEAAIARDRLAPGLRYLLATIELERGRVDAAIAALQQALFLAPSFVLAHVALANAYVASGSRAHASRQIAAARRVLDTVPDDAVLAEADGVPRARLVALIDALAARVADGAA